MKDILKAYCLIIFAFLPTLVFASDVDVDDDGLIEIRSLADLNDIRNHLDGSALYNDSTGCPASGCNGFELTTDLDFDTNGDGQISELDDYWNNGYGWVPIGGDYDENNDDEPFTAIFEGNNHIIKNLYIDTDGDLYFEAVGLFSTTDGAYIQNIGLTGDLLEIIDGSAATGALVGSASNTTIKRSYATGKIDGADGGGLIGTASNSTYIEACFFAGDVSMWNSEAGGLVGTLKSNANIVSSFATGDVSISDGAGKVAGSLVGDFRDAFIEGSFAAASISDEYYGGLVGDNNSGGDINNSYWATERASDVKEHYRGVSLSELQCPVTENDTSCTNGTLYHDWGTYTDEDSNPYWDFGESYQLPALDINGVLYRDSDGDGILDTFDEDNDGDGTPDRIDAFPNDPNESEDTDGDGTGDNADMDDDNNGLIEISSLDDLNEIRNSMDGSSLYGDSTACPAEGCLGFELTSDLDFDTNGDGAIDASDDYWNGGFGWEPLGGNAGAFASTFDGNGYEIHNLYINRVSLSRAGLFGYTEGASISNIGLSGDNMNVTCYYRCGGLVGTAKGNTHISHSYSTGDVTSTGQGNSGMTGGLVGYLHNSTIEISYATGDISSDTGAYVGGLVGQMSKNSNIESSYATGSVTTDQTGNNGFTGGLVGHLDETSSIIGSFATGTVTSNGWNNAGLVGMAKGSITACFASGDVSGEKNIGGLVGFARFATIYGSYATGSLSGLKKGGLVGGNEQSTYNNNYWATDTTDSRRSAGQYTSDSYFGEITSKLTCPTAANNTSCSRKGTVYEDWDSYLDKDGNMYWNFGTSEELPGLVISGEVYR